MRKSLLILLSAFILLFTACDSWMQDDDFYSDIDNDVKVANAAQISVYVRYAMTRQGSTLPDGYNTFKVGIPHEIEATTEPDFGFVRWAAFSTDFLATGDNQGKNKDIYFIDKDDYNKRLLPKEIRDPIVVFEDASNPVTKVTINEERNDIFLVPIVAQRPAVSLTIPARGSNNVVRNMSVRISFTKPMDEASFKNESGVFDKITIEQGTQSFTADGDLEIDSQDITSSFQNPIFSKNKQMITLQFTPEALKDGYAAQSSITITISKEVKDLYGFSMTDDEKVSFTAGSSFDTLAPRITGLTGGKDAAFAAFQGMYKDENIINNIPTTLYLTAGADKAPKSDITATFYDNLIANRVKDKVIIRAYAQDIAGSGEGQDQANAMETDVSLLGVRVQRLYAMDGTPVSDTPILSSVPYIAQTNTSSLTGSYKDLVQAAWNKNPPPGDTDDEKKKHWIDSKYGTIFEYDLKDIPDGLIQIDVAGVDLVGNNGFSSGGNYSSEYGNAYASLFIVKDTTAPDPAANNSHVQADRSGATESNYFNTSRYLSSYKILGDASGIVDAGHARLRSNHAGLKWIIKPVSDTGWARSVSAGDSGWRSVSNDYSGLALPGNQGEVYFTYALMDDLGNISNAYQIPPINYDSVTPSVGTPKWDPAAGSTAGIASESILTKQTLVIPVTEATSGIKKIEFTVKKDGTATTNAPLPSGVSVGGTTNPYNITDSGSSITFDSPVRGTSNITVNGLKLTDGTLGDNENYTVAVKVTDAADNPSGFKDTIISIDSVAPVIEKLYIPGIKGTTEISSSGTTGTTTKYWINNTSTSSSSPRTYIDITFKEAGSGAKVFDFTTSTVKLTNDSALYVNYGTANQRQITCDVNTSLNTLTVRAQQDAAAYLAKKNDSGAPVSLTVRITNIELASSTTDSKAAVVIHDTATMASGLVKTIRSDEGTVGTDSDGYSCFRYDYSTPSANSPSLTDRDSTVIESTETATGKMAAESGYTNDAYINASVTLYPKASGIASITISGDAVFDANTKLYIGSNQIFYSRSADGKTASFQKSATDSGSAVITASSSVSLSIKDLKLTAGEGTNRVSFYPKGFGGLYNSSISSSSIVLDTIPPEWSGAGIYGYGDSNYYNDVYPHSNSSSSPVTGLTNVDSASPNDIYFYIKCSSSAFNIKGRVTDTNKKTSQLFLYTKNGTDYSTDTESSILYGKGYGKYTVVARDKAGNKSTVKTFHIIQDTAFASEAECKAIDNYMTIEMPDSAASVFANTGTKEHQYTDFNYLESTNTHNYSMITRDYIIKQAANPYKIKIKLASGTTSSDKQVDGKTASPTAGNTPYNRLKATTSSAPLEYYSVSHWYEQFSSKETGFENYSFKPFSPDNIPGTTKLSWHKYQTSSSTYTDTDIKSRVDSYGNIEIEIPRTASCPPLSIFLKDACGNITWRLIRPVSFNTDEGTLTNNRAVAWIVDKEVGASNEDVDGYALIGTPEIESGSSYITNQSDVSFYRGSVQLRIHHLTESCRFDTGSENTAIFPTYSASDTSFAYTLKSRIIAWTGSGTPSRDAFGYSNDNSKPSSTPAASAWCFVQQAATGDCPIFDVRNEFPKYSSSDRYKLYLLLEDTVGNYEIRQIRKSSSGSLIVSTSSPSSSDVVYWLYDATGPTVSNINYYKINQVADGSNTYNYYSNKSYVTYTIRDEGSGIRAYGNGSYAYPGWSSMVSSKRVLSNQAINLSSYASLSGTTLTIPAGNIYDYAGNYKGTNITLEYNSNNKWKLIEGLPELTSTSSSTKATAEKTSSLGAVTPTLTSDSNGNQSLSIKAKSKTTSLDVKLYVQDSLELLGWYISDRALTSPSDFYTKAQLNANNSSYNKTITYDSSAYTISYSKGNGNHQAWHSHDNFKTPLYYYPVNRAGRIGEKYVKVYFEENLQPEIRSGESGITYTSSHAIDASYLKSEDTYTIKTSGTGTSAINYASSGAKITFTTNNDPTNCKLVYSIEAGTDGQTGTDDDVYNGYDFDLTLSSFGTGPTYTINLDNSNLISHYTAAAGTPLYIMLSRGNEEDSVLYAIKGPANNNKWIYDAGIPTVSYSGFGYSSVTGDSTSYIKDAKVNLTLTATEQTDSSYGAATGIEHTQWRYSEDAGTSYSDWKDIDSSVMNASLTGTSLEFDAPAKKTKIQFRTIDKAGNISSTKDLGVLQRDDQAPNGVFSYETRKGNTASSTSADKKDLTDNGLGNGKGVDTPHQGDAKERDISYSNQETTITGGDNPYYITHIHIDLSKITDKYTAANVADPENGIERSGIKRFEIKKNGTVIKELSASETSYNIPLTLDDADQNTTFTYTVIAVDNLSQSRVLQTFNTLLDGKAPVLSDLTIQAKDDSGNADSASDAVRYPSSNGTYYLKNAKAHITFNIDDPNATYEWSTNGSSWNNSYHSPLDSSSTSITWTFDAPDTATTYYFRGGDRIGNISSSTSITIQKDMWAPTGSADITTKCGTREVTLASNLVTSSGSGEAAVTEIKYSSNSDAGSENFINNFTITLSSTDDVDGKARSGVKEYQIWEKEGDGSEVKVSTLAATSTSYSGSLSSNSEKVPYSYIVRVVDNIGQSGILKTFILTAYRTAPVFTAPSKVQTKAATDGASAEDAVKIVKDGESIWFLKEANAVFNFTINNPAAKYQWSQSTDGTTYSDYADIPAANMSFSESNDSLTVTFATPESKTYYKFRAVDLVGNVTKISSPFILAKDFVQPTGLFSHSLEAVSGVPVEGTFIDADGTIVYNTSVVSAIEFNFANISDADSGIEGFYLKVGDNEPVKLTSDSTPSLNASSKKASLTLATADGTTSTCVLSVKDMVGHERTLKTITLKADAAAPDLSLNTEHPVQTKTSGGTYDGVLVSGTYYLSRNNAIINFTKAETDFDITKIEYKAEGDENYTDIFSDVTTSDTGISYTFAAPATATRYSFVFEDRVGHVQTLENVVKLVKDTTKPALKEGVSTLSFAGLKEDGTAADKVSDTNPVADYVLSTEGTAVTLTYNPAVVKKISFNALADELSEYETSETASGYAKLYYKIDSGNAVYMKGTDSNVMALADDLNNKTCSIYAEDKVKNQSAALMTVKFVADSTGPVPDRDINNSNDKVKVNNKEITINKLHSYRHNYPDPRQGGYIPFATLKRVPNDKGHAKVNYYTEGTTIKYAASLIPGAVQYQIVQSVNADDGYASVNAVDENWLPVTTDGDDFVFALPDAASTYAKTPYTRLAFFFMDAVGNKTGPYYLGSDESGNYGIQWWILDSAITSSDITISNATWQTPNQYNDTTYWGVKIALPVGTVVHKIEGGDSNVTISNVKFMEANATINNNNSIDYIYQTYNGSNPGIEMNITVKKEVTDSSTVKIKINGVEQGVFVSINTNINRVGGSRIIRGGVAVPVPVSDPDESTGSRIVQFFNNVQNTFAPASEVLPDNKVAEKPVKESKATKAAKKAKKAKKSNGKAVSTGSTTTMAVEAAELLDQTLTSNVPEVAVAGESVVSEIAGVTEKVNAAEQVVSIRPTGYSTTAEASSTTAEAEATIADAGDAADIAEKKTPSKSASIVIMLAILSSFGAVWYLQRNRKK